MGVAKISKNKVPTMRALRSEGAAAGYFPIALRFDALSAVCNAILMSNNKSETAVYAYNLALFFTSSFGVVLL